MALSGGRRLRDKPHHENGSVPPANSKRKLNDSPTNNTSNGGLSNKKAKLSNGILAKHEKLANLIADFNLNVNELFQLREYLSIVSWDPSDVSQNSGRDQIQIPEKFDYFINENKYKLEWDNDNQNLDHIPLRLQRKVLAEREEKLKLKLPFKDSVIERSNEIERSLLTKKVKSSNGNIKNGPQRSLRHRPSETEEKPKQRSKQKAKIVELKEEDDEEVEDEDEDEEEEEEEEEEDLDTNYKLKSISFSINPPIVTHPSHIPAWRPEINQFDSSMIPNDNDNDDEKHKIIDYHPQPIKVISGPENTLSAPDVEYRIRNFLDNNFRSAIIDEVNAPDFNSTPEESEAILHAQEQLLKKLYEKVTIEKRFELNGEKIERRKMVLPHISNTKLNQDPFRETGSVFPKIQGSANSSTHYDYFLEQGLAFSRIHQQIRRQHQLKTRKIAQMIEQHFKKKKGEKDRLRREREQNLKRISRLAVQAVKKRWGQAMKVYRFLQSQKEEELKQIQGREHLSQMLEHSTQLLEAQLSKPREINNEDEDSDDDEEDLKNDSSDFSSSDSSEEEDNNQESANDAEDMKLSIDQLREKYANMKESVEPSSQTNSESESSEEVEDEDEKDFDESQGLAALYGNKPSVSKSEEPVEYSEEQKQLIDSYSTTTKDDSVLDSDSSSDSSSSMSEDESSASESEQDTSVKPTGLASLLSNGNVSNDDSDVSMEEYESEDEDDANLTTDEEDEPTTPVNDSSMVKKEENEKEPQKEEEVNGTRVKDVPIPLLLRGTLRPYQKQGLNWLASLYNNNTNGILADEMGLGKTIQTISLLSYLACEHHIWGPHLIVVPTSVMLNWEMEFKKFAPGFKVLTYYGSPQQRAMKRKGWNKPDAFHVCITSYQLVVHDHQSFKRRRWRYMILDEAHNIKNFRSTRWRALLNFNTENRLLLTGTPLQNNLIELWSLLYFLMPSSKVNQAMPDGFANLENFQQWFGRPVDKILEKTSAGGGDSIDDYASAKSLDSETRNTVSRLHQVLRPYLLRRLKKDVEKQMPGKYEHIVYCRLSKRQRFLYDDFMSRAKTKETLASGNFLSIINCLMQLRKVCNHPDLFEVRPIVTSFAMPTSVVSSYHTIEGVIRKLSSNDAFKQVSLDVLNLDLCNLIDLNYFISQSTKRLQAKSDFENQLAALLKLVGSKGVEDTKPDLDDYLAYFKFTRANDQTQLKEKLEQILYLNTLRCERTPIYGETLLKRLTQPIRANNKLANLSADLVPSLSDRIEGLQESIDKFSIITPTVVALDMKDQIIPLSTQRKMLHEVAENKIENPFHKAQVKLSIAFPDKSLLQYDCGKLQKLASLLQDLTAGGHRALIFTQMTKVLDILEQFLNIHGYRYMRLDGATKIEDRQLLTEKFNRDNKIPVFILSTRSGGLGINLTGADTVIFYDSDWNPAMDKQCQDRCHRIGQSRDVHIYRFVSEYTIESNILRKANQKRQLDNVVIQEGEFTTDYFGKFSVKDLLNDTEITSDLSDKPIAGDKQNMEALAQAEDEDDRAAANEAMKEVAVDDEDFNEESNSARETPSQNTPAPEEEVTTRPANSDAEDADFDEGVGHVDEYMLRFIADGFYGDY